MSTSSSWERLRALFEGALDQSPHRRANFLEAQTDGDESLRREAESLLLAHEAGGRALDSQMLWRHDRTSGGDVPAQPAEHRYRLAAGNRVGPFEILAPLGAGGMGEVYQARDTRLGRLVAIKIVAAVGEADQPAQDRFEREARALSKLSHPHICTVHDVGSAEIDGRPVSFLVMELLDGETLAARMARGLLPLQEALAYAIEMADALSAAHSRGVVHRDLKPANVMLTGSGVKLLDFGLAQLRPAESTMPGTGDESAPVPLTSAGLVFGTLPYMSPEQLRGESADARADVFACGAVLHEMLVGERPFPGDSPADVIAAILEREPVAVSEVRPQASRHLDHVVRKSLAKRRQDRWQTARDLRTELQCIRDEPSQAHSALQERDRPTIVRRWPGWLPLAAMVLILVVLAAVTGWRPGTRGQPPRPVTHLWLNFPTGVRLHIPINGRSFAVSPDGTRIAYVGVRGGRRSLFVHALQTGSTLELPGTADASNPAFSPDGLWLAFVQSVSVKKVPAGGGPIQIVCACPGQHLRWLSDGRLVRATLNSPITEVGPEGSSLTELQEGDEGHHTPVALSDGGLLFTALRAGWHSSRNSVALRPADGSAAREIVSNATSADVVGGDTLIYAQGRSLFAAPFDLAAGRLSGEPRALDVHVQTNSFAAAPMYATARNGTLVYADPPAGRRLVWIDRGGRETFVNSGERMYAHLRISPDGTRVATYQPDGDRDIWVIGLTQPTIEKLTSGFARDVMPVWSHDGGRIFFTTGENKIRSVRSDGSGAVTSVFDGPARERIHPLSISPDGTQLVMQWDTMPTRIDQRVLRLGDRPELLPLVGDSGSERDGRLSPDGRWLAFQSDEAAQGREGHITVRPFPDVHSRRWVISPGLGRQPVWSRDGRELFYRAEDGTVMSVPVRTTPSFQHGPPVPVVTPVDTLQDWAGGPSYDVSPDGRRFLFIKAPELDIRSLHVVLNWDVAVKAKIAGTN